jgi:hypothetical protein
MIDLEKIFDAFPARSYEISGIMRLLEIAESRAIPTACIQSQLSPRILVNPDFVRKYAPTPERQVALLLHEILHLLLGHQSKPVTKLDNFIFDAVINSMITRSTASPAYWSLFTSVYSDRRFPECLLRPPSNYVLKAPVAPPPAISHPKFAAIRAAYRNLYSEFGSAYSDLRKALLDYAQNHPWFLGGEQDPEGSQGGGADSDRSGQTAEVSEAGVPMDREGSKESETSIDDVTLLGRHPVQLLDHLRLSGELQLAAYRFWRVLGYAPHSRCGISNSHFRVSVELPRMTEHENTVKLVHLIQKVAKFGFREAARKQAPGKRPMQSVLPALDRRSNVLRFLGLDPLLYLRETPVRDKQGIEPVHVYVDVSGSIFMYVPSLYRAVLTCANLVHPRVHLFSTSVTSVSLEDILCGRVETTGGTDIGCVLRHMHRWNVRRAVILTDGYVGKPEAELSELLKQCLVGVALTPDGSTSDMEEFARFTTRLVL